MDRQIKVYALSTCIWCKKTIKFFTEKGVKFEHIFVDLLEGEESEKIEKELKELNAGTSFPIVVIDGKVIAGYKTDEFEKVLKK